MYFALAGLALVGHFALCVAAINRLHSMGMPRVVMRVVDLVWMLLFFGVPASVTAWAMVWSPTSGTPPWRSPVTWLVGVYFVVTGVAAVVTMTRIIRRQRCAPTTKRLVENHTRCVGLSGERPVGDFLTWLASRLPGNQILQLSVHEKSISIPRLPAELDGLAIAHLSDLHFTGQLTADFFDAVVRHTNQLDADLVAITGDIIDTQRCLPWIPEILGKLTSRYGVFSVLGNHELRLPRAEPIRRALIESGIADLGGRWQTIEVHGRQIVLAGNELPWFGPAADLSDCPTTHPAGRPLRILLSHSPDQLPWARSFDMDLMLAGHVHGGQFRLPLIGPVVCPSRYGVWYASGSGAFYEMPTLLHVSRGISGTRPFRFNCPPELTRLVLKRE